MMTVNGLQLPASFAKFWEGQRYTTWDLKQNVDAYGNPLNADFWPLGAVDDMEQRTEQLVRDFGPSGPEVQPWGKQPSYLFDIDDFSKIACFGRTAGGAPFCFDFRENAEEPSVIFFNGAHGRWRKVAPDFKAFIGLYERDEEDEEE